MITSKNVMTIKIKKDVLSMLASFSLSAKSGSTKLVLWLSILFSATVLAACGSDGGGSSSGDGGGIGSGSDNYVVKQYPVMYFNDPKPDPSAEPQWSFSQQTLNAQLSLPAEEQKIYLRMPTNKKYAGCYYQQNALNEFLNYKRRTVTSSDGKSTPRVVNLWEVDDYWLTLLLLNRYDIPLSPFYTVNNKGAQTLIDKLGFNYPTYELITKNVNTSLNSCLFASSPGININAPLNAAGDALLKKPLNPITSYKGVDISGEITIKSLEYNGGDVTFNSQTYVLGAVAMYMKNTTGKVPTKYELIKYTVSNPDIVRDFAKQLRIATDTYGAPPRYLGVDKKNTTNQTPYQFKSVRECESEVTDNTDIDKFVECMEVATLLDESSMHMEVYTDTPSGSSLAVIRAQTNARMTEVLYDQNSNKFKATSYYPDYYHAAWSDKFKTTIVTVWSRDTGLQAMDWNKRGDFVCRGGFGPGQSVAITIEPFTYFNRTNYGLFRPFTLACTIYNAPCETCAITPPIVKVAALAQKITLDWDVNSNVKSPTYTVYRSESTIKDIKDSGVTKLTTINATRYEDTSLNTGTTYHYVVTAEGDSRVSAPSNEVSAKLCKSCTITPPVVTVAVAGKKITLNWDANSKVSNPTYTVYRSESTITDIKGSGVNKLTTINATTYEDTSLNTGTTYYYVVITEDDKGNNSIPSNEVSAALITPPVVTVTASAGKITLNWNANSNVSNPTYTVYRSESPITDISNVTIYSIGDATTYDDTTAQNGTTYYYVVTTKDNNGRVSAPSNVVSAALITPPVVTVTASTGKITLNWDANSNVSSPTYTVYRSESSITDIKGSGVTELTTINATTYEDTSLSTGTTYYYVVTTKDDKGKVSAPSNEVSAQFN